MSKNTSGPIDGGQASAPKSKGDNTAVKIVLIVALFLVGLPILLAIAALIFVSANMDKILDWVDEHDWSATSYYEVDNARATSASTIYSMTKNERIRKNSGLAKVDCENMKLLAELSGASFVSDSLCDEETISIGSETYDSTVRLMIADNEKCSIYSFSDTFKKYISYDKKDVSACKELSSVKLTDTGETAEPITGNFKKYHNDSINIEEDENGKVRKFVLERG